MNEVNSYSKLRRYIVGFLGIAVLLVVLIVSPKIFENVNADEICVIQAPWTGRLDVYTDAGTKWQGFGTVTIYKKSFQYWFDGKEGHNPPIPIQFYDGGHANIPGSIRVDMPLDEVSVIKIHTKFGSQSAVENQLIAQILTKSVYMSGPIMSSRESYAEKKNDLIFYIEDQASHGVYKTKQKEIRITDALTGQERVVTAVEIVNDDNALPYRQEKSLVSELGIRLNNLSPGAFDYDQTVKQQIAAQQQATMQVQTAIANAKRAEQDAITVEQQGKADAAKAKWDQEVIKAKLVTEAQQKKEVATLDALTAEQEKRANILRGEGEAAYKKLVTQANNNLELKLEAWKYAQEKWADAFARFQGNLVPLYQSGNGSQQNAVNWMEIMGMKAARDLDLDLNTRTK